MQTTIYCVDRLYLYGYSNLQSRRGVIPPAQCRQQENYEAEGYPPVLWPGVDKNYTSGAFRTCV